MPPRSGHNPKCRQVHHKSLNPEIQTLASCIAILFSPLSPALFYSLFHHYIISLNKCRVTREPGGQRWITDSDRVPGHNISAGEDNAVDQTRRRANLAERWRKRD